MKPCPCPKVDNYKIAKFIDKFKESILQNHWANFNYTWHKTSWMKEIQVCSNEGPCPCPRVDNYKIAKFIDKFKESILQNHLANFNQTWHKSSLSEGNSNLFK